jgi:NAD(P)-dependent dehydrogenase (short-subunit alcohol dehydrogenase family)
MSENVTRPAAAGRLAGRVVILTGAAGGIGQVYARRLGAEGARLSLIDLDGDGLRTVAAECRALGAETVELVVDLSDAEAARLAVDETAERLGGVDALVNNAALFSALPSRAFVEIPADEVDRVLTVNVRAPFVLCQAVVPHLRRRGGGKIVNIGSGIVLSASPGMAHYTVSKGAIFALTRALARELGADGITVNTLAPGFTLTDTLRARTDQPVDSSRRSRPLNRDEVPEDLEGTLVYLLSSDSDFVTGQMIVVNGGSVFW